MYQILYRNGGSGGSGALGSFTLAKSDLEIDTDSMKFYCQVWTFLNSFWQIIHFSVSVSASVGVSVNTP